LLSVQAWGKTTTKGERGVQKRVAIRWGNGRKKKLKKEVGWGKGGGDWTCERL